MAGYNKFKSYKAKDTYVSNNPYVQRAMAKHSPAIEEPKPSQSTDELKTNNTLLARVTEMAREIKDLRLDIASLLLFIQGDMDTNFTAADARALYFDFKASKGHLMNRISDKLDKDGQSNL
jgi:hypothetical protein